MLKKPNIFHKLTKCFKKMSAPYVKLETPLSDHALLCRGCLADCGEMKDIREWGLIEDFRKYAGVQLRSSDGVSELICSTCEDSLMKSKLFEMQCRKSDMTLRSLAVNNSNNAWPEENKVYYQFTKNELICNIIAPDPDKNLDFPCPFTCKESYTKKNDLFNHIIKVHKHNKNYKIEYRYHCWEKNCVYHKNGGKCFYERKYINQHYNRVHRSKIFHCEKCNKDFATTSDLNRHHSTCNMVFPCEDCDKEYNNRERLLVHLMRHHPAKHKEYKEAKKAEKRKAATETISKIPRLAVENLFETDSPKRSFATQTLNPKDSIKNDVALPSWHGANNEISTQTGFEDLLSIKSNSEEDSLFYSETTLSDIQTQTFPLEFGLVVNRSNKETLTESLDISIKGTQTCFCYCDSPKLVFGGLESFSLSPRSGNLTSTETQTADLMSSMPSDVLLSLNSTETQTCFDEAFNESL